MTPTAVGRLELPPLAGRMFGGRDTPDGCRVVVVNEEAAADLLAGDARRPGDRRSVRRACRDCRRRAFPPRASAAHARRADHLLLPGAGPAASPLGRTAASQGPRSPAHGARHSGAVDRLVRLLRGSGPFSRRGSSVRRRAGVEVLSSSGRAQSAGRRLVVRGRRRRWYGRRFRGREDGDHRRRAVGVAPDVAAPDAPRDLFSDVAGLRREDGPDSRRPSCRPRTGRCRHAQACRRGQRPHALGADAR